MNTITNTQGQYSPGKATDMKLKDKKIEICKYQYTTDAIGNHKKTLVSVAKVWAYFRQLSGKEIETGISTKTNETVLFKISYRADLKTTHVIKYNGILYDITRVDVFEGYKSDLAIYCQADT